MSAVIKKSNVKCRHWVPIHHRCALHLPVEPRFTSTPVDASRCNSTVNLVVPVHARHLCGLLRSGTRAHRLVFCCQATTRLGRNAMMWLDVVPAKNNERPRLKAACMGA